MKKRLIAGICGLLLLLSGCSFNVDNTARVETLKGWSFQSNDGTNDYSLFFGLLDKNDNPIAAEVDVDIRIVNDSDEVVYTGTKTVSINDYGYYTSQVAGEQYLANIRIPASAIVSGTSSSGKVYLTVHKENVVQFDEVNCDALYCLPVRDVQVYFDDFPQEIKVKDYMGGTSAVIEIQSAEYSFDSDYSLKLSITVYGQKLSGGDSVGYDMVSYKLYDNDGYMVDSGDLYLQSLSAGDKFKEEITIYDVTPGETYTMKLFEYSW